MKLYNPPILSLIQPVDAITYTHINVQFIPEDDGWTYEWDHVPYFIVPRGLIRKMVYIHDS
jgi:hypothetical protein